MHRRYLESKWLCVKLRWIGIRISYLAYDFYDTELRNRHNEETRIIQDAMFCTLKKILELESEYCQEAALHGLGHLRHPETKIAIEAYLRKNSRLSKEQKKYAKACITGDIM